MFGFIESWLAEKLGITDCTDFVLSNNLMVKLVDKDTFDAVYNLIHRIHVEEMRLLRLNGHLDDCGMIPRVFNSDVVGVKVIVHRYHSNYSVLDCITDGATKERTPYTEIMNFYNQNGSFSSGWFEDQVVRFWVTPNVQQQFDTPQPHTTAPIGEELLDETFNLAEPEPVEVLDTDIPIGGLDDLDVNHNFEHNRYVASQTESPDVDFDGNVELACEKVSLGFFDKIVSNIAYRYQDEYYRKQNVTTLDSGYSVCIFNNVGMRDGLDRYFDFFSKIAEKYKKDVIVTVGGPSSTNCLIRSDFNIKDVSKEIIIINYVLDTSDYFIVNNNPVTSTCFGYNVLGIAEVRSDNSNGVLPFGSTERDDALIRFKNSPYRKYDRVFKDTITNVVFAVKEKALINILIRPLSSQDIDETVLNELLRRLAGDVKYSDLVDIDTEYQKNIIERDKNYYIEHSVSNSDFLIKELKANYESNMKQGNEFMNKAMEHMKMAQKYLDQIEAFDEEGFFAREREKAKKVYNETLALDKVSSIRVEGDFINVYTKNIYAIDDRSGKWHDIGTFNIRIGMHNNKYDTSNTVRIRNTKHQVRGLNSAMQAPHVFPDGHICHGNLAIGMTEAYKRKDLFQLVMQIIIFLQQANTDDAAGKYIDRWPEVSKDVALGLVNVDLVDCLTESESKFDEMLLDIIK
jgi:hypothetical protein